MNNLDKACNMSSRQIADLLAERDELVAALKAVIGNIDMSTINNSKRSTERWVELKEHARAALAKVSK